MLLSGWKLLKRKPSVIKDERIIYTRWERWNMPGSPGDGEAFEMKNDSPNLVIATWLTLTKTVKDSFGWERVELRPFKTITFGGPGWPAVMYIMAKEGRSRVEISIVKKNLTQEQEPL